MQIKLAVITTRIHLDNFKKVEEKLKTKCQMEYFLIDSLEECGDYYLSNAALFDAFLVSGPLLYQALLRKVQVMDKPCYVVSDDAGNIYKKLLGLAAGKRELDFSRVYIDFASEYNNYLDFREIFPTQERPPLIPWQTMDMDIVQTRALKNHIDLWEEGKIDLSITRFGFLVEEFKKRGYNYLFIAPSESHLYMTISKLLSELRIKKLEMKKIALGYLSLDRYSMKNLENYDSYELSIFLASIAQEIEKFATMNSCELVVQTNKNHLDLYMSQKDLFKITQNMTQCPLLARLNKHLDLEVSLGFGTGKNLYQAKRNAKEANLYARSQGGNSCFYSDENHKIIGPIGRSSTSYFYKSPSSSIMDLSNRLDIDNIQLQKIISFAKKIGSNKLSSDDAALCLSVEKRSANRILNKIQEKGGASVSFEKRDAGRGRPKKYYRLDFLTRNGEEDIEAFIKRSE